MTQIKVQQEIKIEEQQNSKRKLIQKVKRKVKRQEKRLVAQYGHFADQPGSGIGSILNAKPQDDRQIDMVNQITMGQNRKLKKKMKKLQKQMPNNPQRVFNEIQKFKKGFYQHHQKTIFKPVDEMAKRRERRKQKMQANAKKRKAEVTHKNLDRFD